MPRYLVERTFPEEFDVPPGQDGRRLLGAIVAGNADRNVNWICSYVARDRHTVYCVYDAPNPEAIRRSARSTGLPVDRIIEVSVLDPYAFHVLECSPGPQIR